MELNSPQNSNENSNTSTEVLNKADVFIVDDKNYALFLKNFLEEKFTDRIHVHVFPSSESCLEMIKNLEKRPQVVLLDYKKNKVFDSGKIEHVVDQILDLSPETGIIMTSDKEFEKRAMKSIRYGAHNFVVKDQFAFEHIVESVEAALNPPKK